MQETKPSPPIEVQVSAAQVSFGVLRLFDHLELTLPAGQWTSLLGASGVGKSTLLRLIAGLDPGRSDVSLRCTDDLPLTGRAAYMAQQDLLLPWLSVIDNVMLGARLRGGRRECEHRHAPPVPGREARDVDVALGERPGLGLEGERPARLPRRGSRRRRPLCRSGSSSRCPWASVPVCPSGAFPRKMSVPKVSPT